MISLLGCRGTASWTQWNTKQLYDFPFRMSWDCIYHLEIQSLVAFEFSSKISQNLFYYFLQIILCNCMDPPWNVASYHLESIPKISLNLFYFPKNTTLNALHLYLRQPLNSNLFQTPKKLPNPSNSSPNFAILVHSNAPLKTSQFC